MSRCRYPVGSESRLSREGLAGASIGRGRQQSTIRIIMGHCEPRRTRTVYLTNGQMKNMRISTLLRHLLSGKGY